MKIKKKIIKKIRRKGWRFVKKLGLVDLPVIRNIVRSLNYHEEKKQLRMEIRRLRREAIYYRESKPTNWYLRFARQALEISDALGAEVHIAHGVQALPAADMVARTAGGRLFCDVIEIPAFSARVTATDRVWDATTLAFLDRAFESYLQRCDGILTVGWALKREIEHFGPPIHVIPNYRLTEELAPSLRMRERCALEKNDVLILAISLLHDGLEDVIGALRLLPDHVHLALMGRFYPRSYRASITALLDELRLRHRVHLLDPVPYAELSAAAAGADLGLVVLNPRILNNRVALPNRIFDYMAAGLPVCSPEIPDIIQLLREHDMGVVVETLDPAGWACAIRSALARKPELSANALAAAKQLAWESLEDALFDVLGQPNSVTYYGQGDLTKNNRTLRMARSLAKRGVGVTIFTRSREAPPPVPNGVRFHILAVD